MGVSLVSRTLTGQVTWTLGAQCQEACLCCAEELSAGTAKGRRPWRCRQLKRSHVALSAAAQEAIWLRRLLSDLGWELSQPTAVMEDNQGAIAIVKNPVQHKRTKHIDIRHHFIREAVERGEIAVDYCPTNQMVADILTKPLPKPKFLQLRPLLGLK